MYRTGWPWWIHVTLAYATLTSWTAVLVSGFSTFDGWPSSGWAGNIERFVGFFACAFITRSTITNHETRLQISCWTVVAVIFEIGRQRMVGRSNGVLGWVIGLAGASIGAILARQIAHTMTWHNDW